MKATVTRVGSDGRLEKPRAVTWPTIIRGNAEAMRLAAICAVCPHLRALCCDRGGACRKIDDDNEFRLARVLLGHPGAACPEGRHF